MRIRQMKLAYPITGRRIKACLMLAGAAAVAFAPAAAADTDLSALTDAEISGLNSLFDTEAVVSGIPLTDVDTAGTFDFVSPQDVTLTQLNAFEHLLYGADQLRPDIDSSFDLYNGALANFDDAFNVEVYALLDGGALDPDGADFFGSFSDVTSALDTGTVSGAVGTFLTEGWHELLLYFDIGAVTVY